MSLHWCIHEGGPLFFLPNGRLLLESCDVATMLTGMVSTQAYLPWHKDWWVHIDSDKREAHLRNSSSHRLGMIRKGESFSQLSQHRFTYATGKDTSAWVETKPPITWANAQSSSSNVAMRWKKGEPLGELVSKAPRWTNSPLATAVVKTFKAWHRLHFSPWQ